MEIDPYLKTEKGVEKLINHLKQKNIPIAISTGSTTTSYGIKTQNYKKIFDQADFQIDSTNQSFDQSEFFIR